MMRQKVTVVGIGYVGLGVGAMLSTSHDVMMLDVDQKKVDLINERKSPIKDEMISRYLGTKESISISATTDSGSAYDGADFIIVAVPTNYDEDAKMFDTRIVENVVNEAITQNRNAVVIIKSTIPVGYTAGLIERLEGHGFKNPKVLFSPEFLREGTALKDNLFPSRVIVGCRKGDAKQFLSAQEYLYLIRSVTEGKYQELIMGNTEAEAVKLFANTYLAMRVAYFNELDTYAECNGLDAKEIIEGMCYDPRIGNQYNNPSFGYGGYCFPKDTKQLLSNFEGIPQNLIGAIVDSNDTRKKHIIHEIEQRLLAANVNSPVLGVYRLSMKSGSDNYRKSAILDIMDGVRFQAFVYEPTLPKEIKTINERQVIRSLGDFKKKCAVIITNRYDSELDDVKEKVYTRDIFNNN